MNKRMIPETSQKNRHFDSLLLGFLVLAVIWHLSVMTARADEVMTLTYPVTFDQNKARSMLTIVNNYRASKGSGALTWDYALESAAMQRAAELAFNDDHERPDGTKCFTAIPSGFTNARSHSESENICTWSAPDISAEGAVSMFAGSYAHNAAMLNSSYVSCGFGYAEVDGEGSWVQLFSSAYGTWGYQEAFTGTRNVTIQIRTSLFQPKINMSSLSVSVGVPAELPSVYKVANRVRCGTYPVTWSSSDTSIVQISGNQIIPVGSGSAYVTGTTSEGKTVSLSVYSSYRYVSGADISIDNTTFTYDGKAKTPGVKLVYDGYTLVKGTDYTVAYSDNINVGYARITITGIGKFSGEATRNFYIQKAKQTLKPKLSVSGVQVGKTAKISVKGKGTITYSSGNIWIAEVGYETGVVKGVAAGTCVITVKASGNANYEEAAATLTVTVKKAAKKVSPDGKPLTIKKAPTLAAKQKLIKKAAGNKEVSGSTFHLLRLHTKAVGKNYVTLSWAKVKGATGYTIYGNIYSKKNGYKKLATVNSGSTTSKKITKIGKTKLKKARQYKFLVVATKKNSLGTKKAIATSKALHVITMGSRKYGNYKSVKLKTAAGKKLTLKKGKTYRVKAAAVKPSGKKVKVHRGLKYESTKKSVATVSAKGKITARKAGVCYIYVYAQNGAYQRIKLTVK